MAKDKTYYDLSSSTNKVLVEITAGTHEKNDGSENVSEAETGYREYTIPDSYDQAIFGKFGKGPKVEITHTTWWGGICGEALALFARTVDDGEGFCACPHKWRRLTVINPFLVVVELPSGAVFCLASEDCAVMNLMVWFAYKARDADPTKGGCERVAWEKSMEWDRGEARAPQGTAESCDPQESQNAE